MSPSFRRAALPALLLLACGCAGDPGRLTLDLLVSPLPEHDPYANGVVRLSVDYCSGPAGTLDLTGTGRLDDLPDGGRCWIRVTGVGTDGGGLAEAFLPLDAGQRGDRTARAVFSLRGHATPVPFSGGYPALGLDRTRLAIGPDQVFVIAPDDGMVHVYQARTTLLERRYGAPEGIADGAAFCFDPESGEAWLTGGEGAAGRSVFRAPAGGGRFVRAGFELAVARSNHACAIFDGLLAVAGGSGGAGTWPGVEAYDTTGGRLSGSAGLACRRERPGLVLDRNRLLVAMGHPVECDRPAEAFAISEEGVEVLPPPLPAAWLWHASVTGLGSGRALIAGGAAGLTADGRPDLPLSSRRAVLIELDGEAGPTAIEFPLLQPRCDHAAAHDGDGRVVLAGGTAADGGPLAGIELVSTDRLEAEPAGTGLAFPRAGADAVRLDDGSWLVIGGRDGSGPRTDGELIRF